MQYDYFLYVPVLPVCLCVLIWLVKLQSSFGWFTERFLIFSESNLGFNFSILINPSSKICIRLLFKLLHYMIIDKDTFALF